MEVILQVIGGPAAGMRIVVRPGQVVQVGRTKWADYSLPDDGEMADVHFMVEFDRQECRIRDLNTGSGTAVNGNKVAGARRLHTGDEVTAGRTTFSVLVEGEPAPGGEPADATTQETPATATEPKADTPVLQTAADYCRDLEIEEEAQQLLNDTLTPAEFLDLLTEHELFPDAIRFLAFWLPKPGAVAWACQCVREVLGGQLKPKDNEAIESAQQWVRDPTEENRYAAGAIAETTGFSGPPSWVAVAAFWSGGSLAPADLPPVPPGESMTAQAITGALMMTATHGEPLKAAERYRSFLQKGKQLALRG